jgi:hypothetical protein
MAKPGQSSTPGDSQVGQTVPNQAEEDVPIEFINDEPEPGDVVDGDYIQYTGGASIREITRRQFEQAGVGRQQGIEWTVANRHLVPVDQFTDAARERVLKEPGFRIVNAADVP